MSAIGFAHPARMHARACAHGLCGPRFDEAFRYLHIGAGDGSHLLPLAARFSHARFAGVEADDARRARAEADAARAGLTNLTLHARPTGERYHYVVAHGIYSWIGDRDSLLADVAAALHSDGIALVSYNTLPGWAIRGVLREVMLRAASSAQDDRVIAARSAAARLEGHLRPDDPYRALLAAELALIRGKSDAELCDDDLAEHNAPVSVDRFVAHAEAHGLAYLAEMMPASADGLLDGDILPALLAELPRIDAEQQLDLLCYRQLRATLLCRAGAAIRDTPDDRPLFEEGYLSARLEPAAEEPLLAPGKILRLSTPRGAVLEVERPLLKAALLTLAEQWPRGASLRELMSAAMKQLEMRNLADARNVNEGEISATTLELAALVRRRQLELCAWRPRVVEEVPPTPRLHPVTAIEAERAPEITDARHDPIALDDVARTVFRLLDGSRDFAALRAALQRRVDGGALPLDVPPDRRPDAVADLVMRAVIAARNLGLLCPPDSAP